MQSFPPMVFPFRGEKAVTNVTCCKQIKKRGLISFSVATFLQFSIEAALDTLSAGMIGERGLVSLSVHPAPDNYSDKRTPALARGIFARARRQD